MVYRSMLHPHVLQYRGTIVTQNYFCVVMEYANLRTLSSVVYRNKGFSEAQARFVFQKIVLTLDYCQHPEINMTLQNFDPSSVLMQLPAGRSSSIPVVKLTGFTCASAPLTVCLFSMLDLCATSLQARKVHDWQQVK